MDSIHPIHPIHPMVANSPFYLQNTDLIENVYKNSEKTNKEDDVIIKGVNCLDVMSYNIWFDEKDRYIRTEALIKNIKKHSPDVICLQEVIPEIYNKLKSKLCEYKYYFPNEVTNRYGCVIFSKHIMTHYYDNNYPNTQMGRNLLAVNIKYNMLISNVDNKSDSLYDNIEITPIDITIATSHFESLFDPVNTNIEKIEQYMFANNLLNKLYDKGNPVILCSDTNLLPHE
jgi:exonuclease III